MTNDFNQTVLAAWAAKNLAARLDVSTTARVLGFAEHDIQILMATRKLTPLGDPAQNAPKWFAAVDVLQLATDKDWLHKATKDVSKYWRNKRERRADHPGKVSPNSSPKVTPAGRKTNDGEANISGEPNCEKAA